MAHFDRSEPGKIFNWIEEQASIYAMKQQEFGKQKQRMVITHVQQGKP
jgi:hypothetical protein